MDSNAIFKGMKNLQHGVRRTAARAQVEVRKAVGLSHNSLSETHPEYEAFATDFRIKTKELETLQNCARSSLETIQKVSSTAYTIATHQRDSLLSPPSQSAYRAADALVKVHEEIIDNTLPRIERRIMRRVVEPVAEELTRSRELLTHMEARKRCLQDAARYEGRASEASATADDARKAADKLGELEQRTAELISSLEDAKRRRVGLFDRVVGETVEFQRRFYIDYARNMEGLTEMVGAESLAMLRGSAEDTDGRSSVPFASTDDLASALPMRKASTHTSQTASSAAPKAPLASSMWQELDEDRDERDDDGYGHFESPPPRYGYDDERRPPRRSAYDDDAKPPRRSAYDDDAKPPRRSAYDDDAKPPRRSVYDDEPKAAPRTGNLFDDDDDAFFNQAPPSTATPSYGKEAHSAYPSNGVGQRESASAYPSSGIGQRESTGGYPSAGVGQRESVGSYPSGGIGMREKLATSSSGTRPVDGNGTANGAYPSGGSRVRENSYPNLRSRVPSKASVPLSASSSRESESMKATSKARTGELDAEGDLLGFNQTAPAASTRAARVRGGTANVGANRRNDVEDLLDLGGDGGTKNGPTPFGRSASVGGASAVEGDLLGDFGVTNVAKASSRARRPGGAGNPGGLAAMASSSAPNMRKAAPVMGDGGRHGASAGGAGGGMGGAGSKLNESIERERLKKMHEAEIKARADEKLATVREREQAEATERERKDSARGQAERKIDAWTGNGARRGNLRALLASLDSVLYSGATWKGVSMDVLKENSKVKVNYHKAILQVHPDKISSKGLAPDQLVLAELVFDELKNGYEVWTAECEGRAPPPGSVGPKGGAGLNNKGGMGGMGGMSGMGNMGGMGRGGMGNMGGMGGMGMGRGGMGGMGMGMGMGNMGGMNRPPMGRGGMANSRRGTGMGNMPQSNYRR